VSRALPGELSDWSAQLNDLADYTLGTLSPWLTRLEHVMGPLVRRPLQGPGEPDGVDGLARSGSWERLLASEWALADAAPMEFLRRASAGEQSFLRLASTTPSTGFDLVVLLDAGPFQFGAPRLVQLAMLAVLARAAAAAHARFRWGVLQEPDGPLFTGLASDDVRRWLDRRSLEAVSRPLMERWHDRLDLAQDGDELWLVGAAGVEGFGHRAAEIADAVTPVGRYVDVAIHQPDTPPRRLRLELPSDRRCTRILREPFARDARRPLGATDAGFGDALPMLFAPSGRRLVMRLKSGDAAAFHVPNSPRGEPGATRVITARDGERFVALGWHQRRFAGLAVDGHGLSRVRVAGGTESIRVTTARWRLGDLFEGNEPVMRLLFENADALLLQGPDGVLRRLRTDATGVETVFEGVVGVCQSHGRVVVAAMSLGQPLELYALSRDGQDTRTLYTMPPSPSGHVPRVFFGHGGWQGPDNVELVAAEYAPGSWRVVQGRYRLDLEVSPGTRVVGVTQNLRFGSEPSLVINDGQRVTLEGARDTWPLPRTGANVIAAGCNHADAQVVWITDQDRLTVYSLEHRKAVLQADLRRLEQRRGSKEAE